MDETTIVLSIVGTGIGVTAVVVSVVALVASGINSRLSAMGVSIDRLRGDMREDHRALDARLRAVEIQFGKVEQRLETVEQRLETVEQRLETVERAVLPQAPAV